MTRCCDRLLAVMDPLHSDCVRTNSHKQGLENAAGKRFDALQYFASGYYLVRCTLAKAEGGQGGMGRYEWSSVENTMDRVGPLWEGLQVAA